MVVVFIYIDEGLIFVSVMDVNEVRSCIWVNNWIWF